ncbi:MAG: hypothetical protein K9L59_02065 [Desulfobacterales bacterium]|nr:hypothetical protein [Desulfobacterales bacterium]
MSHSLAGALALMQPHLDPAIVSEKVFARMVKLACLLPPIYWGGFECHLGDGPHSVDFHQGYNQVEEFEKFVHFFSARLGSGNLDIFKRLKRFRSQWALSGSRINKAVDKVSLEFDVIRADDTTRCPCMFLFLSPFISLTPTDSRLMELVQCFVSQMFDEATAKQIWGSVKNLSLITDHAAIGYLGAMTSREKRALRLVVAKLPLERLAKIINHLSPAIDSIQIDPLLSKLKDSNCAFFLNLDILCDSISPRIGIECYPKSTTERPDGWPALLRRFQDLGLCSKDQAGALIQWQGLTTPQKSKTPWPAELVSASLLKQPHEFTSFSRSLNHIKIDFSPLKRPKAKAYLEFKHGWMDLKNKSSEGADKTRNRERE